MKFNRMTGRIRQTGTHRKGMNAVHGEAVARAQTLRVGFWLRDYRPVPMPKRPFPNCPWCKGGGHS